jgi:hypothetical protein
MKVTVQVVMEGPIPLESARVPPERSHRSNDSRACATKHWEASCPDDAGGIPLKGSGLRHVPARRSKAFSGAAGRACASS